MANLRQMIDGLATYPVGEGDVSVVYLPGAGLVGLDYLNLTSVHGAAHLLYDRGGTGWSGPVDLPRTAAQVAQELRDVAGPGPHVLVAHSMGAIYARRFAQLFPSATAGLLLLDPGHEDLFDYLPPEAGELNRAMKPDPAALPDLTPEQLDAGRQAWRKILADWPAEVRDELVEQHLAHWRTGLLEAANLESEVYDEVRRGGPVADVPTIVISAGAGNPAWASFGAPELVRQAIEGIGVLHAKLAASFSRGEHRVLAGATHNFLHIERPDEVRGALSDLMLRLG